MHVDVVFKEVVQVMSRWSSEGDKQLSSGVRLVCPTPHVAPEAWLHVLYPPAAVGDIQRAEKQLGTLLPDEYKAFLLRANGLEMFSYRLAVWGIRKNMARTGDEAWQPFDLVNHNYESNRPKASPSDFVYFGSVDGGETWCFFESNHGSHRVGKTSRESYKPDTYWPNFGTWLRDEVRSIESVFDADSVVIGRNAGI
jgi:hypothetical protein